MSDIPQFEEGEIYAKDDLPENQMVADGELEWVDSNEDGAVLALATKDGQQVTLQWSHVRCTDVKYLDFKTGDLVDSRDEIGGESDE